MNLLKEVPKIRNHKELEKILEPIYIIHNHTKTYEEYENLITSIYNIVKGCYTIYECRTYPVKFKFYLRDKKTYTLELRLFLVNLFLWYAFVELHEIECFDESFIFSDPEKIPDIDDYLNNKLIYILNYYHIKTVKKNSCISRSLYDLRSISLNFSDILGLNFSTPMFIDLYRNNDRVREIMETKFDPSMQPYEIEEKIQSLKKEEIEIFKSIKDLPIGIVLRAKTGIKDAQLAEFTIAEGLKPTIDGTTIPRPIESSTLIGGLNKPSYVAIDTKASRKSLIFNKTDMGTSGYFAKLCALLAGTLRMSTKVLDCDTKHLVEYNVDSKLKLKKLIGKYYKLTDDPNEEYKIIDGSRDKKLIGKKIRVRSAACCALGDEVCPRCIGIVSSTNVDIAEGLSTFETEEITKVVSQNILSSKHLLTTKSEVIRFNDDFYMFFNMFGGEVYPFIENNNFVEIGNYDIVIDMSNIEKIEEMDEDSLYNNILIDGRFIIRDSKHPENGDIPMYLLDEKDIYISSEFYKILKKNNGVVHFSDLDIDDKLFEIVIENNELTKPLYSIMHLLNRKPKGVYERTIDDILNEFFDLLIESRIPTHVVSIELIINRLIRSIENPYERPDFSKSILEPYEIVTVQKALKKNKSPLIGISSDHIKQQILSDDFFEERCGTSYVDCLYKENINTENLKKYSDYVKMDEISDFLS